MITTLRKARAELSEMVRLASQGEDVIITGRGEPTAQLTAIRRASSPRQRPRWLAELKSLRRATATGRAGAPAGQLTAEDRAQP
jgi:prevent-host-death family protein